MWNVTEFRLGQVTLTVWIFLDGDFKVQEKKVFTPLRGMFGSVLQGVWYLNLSHCKQWVWIHFNFCDIAGKSFAVAKFRSGNKTPLVLRPSPVSFWNSETVNISWRNWKKFFYRMIQTGCSAVRSVREVFVNDFQFLWRWLLKGYNGNHQARKASGLRHISVYDSQTF